MKYNLMFLLMFLLVISLFAQTAEIDSLKTVIERTTGTEEIDAVNMLAKAYWQVDLELSIESGNSALKLSEQLNYKKGEAEAIKNIGGAHYFLGDYDIAVELFVESLELRKEI
ncbi:MAG: hypothetical protein HOD64_09515, partial [Candidatus Cloacimonetes bacterium]|nr:hypothetical protein [Candidatus Cloacimonadota bacterium]